MPAPLRGFAAAVDLLMMPLLAAVAVLSRLLPGGRHGRIRVFFGTMHINHLPPLAAALRRRAVNADVVVWNPPRHEIGHVPYDIVISSSAGRLFRLMPIRYLIQFGVFVWVVARYDVVVMPFRNRLIDRSVLARWVELPLLRLAGVRIVLNSYGADIMAPRAVFGEQPGFNVAMGYREDPQYVSIDERDVMRNARYGERWADLVVASMDHSDYLRRIDAAIHLRGIEPARYSPSYITDNRVPVVVHAPNHRALKGTDYLIAAVERLQADGVSCELRIIEGQPHDAVLQEVRAADIVADQFIIGAYGRFAIEGMMLGKPVLCYLRDELFAHNPHWSDAPILNANPMQIENVLRELLSMGLGERAALGRKSREFAIRLHSADAVAERFLELLQGRFSLPVSRCTRRTET